jgi:deferrochelatase/peroxidase EfeB
VDLPPFPGDELDLARSGGDLCIQACANDPQVAVYAVRNLARLGAGVVNVRWSQLGFGRTSSTSTGQATPRNLFGFKDGTNNSRRRRPARSTSSCGSATTTPTGWPGAPPWSPAGSGC